MEEQNIKELINILKILVGLFCTYEWKQHFEIYVKKAAIAVFFLKWEQHYTHLDLFNIYFHSYSK